MPGFQPPVDGLEKFGSLGIGELLGMNDLDREFRQGVTVRRFQSGGYSQEVTVRRLQYRTHIRK